LKWLLLGGAIITEVAGSLSLKGALEHPLLYIVVVVGYLAAFVLLTLVLRAGVAVGVAYGIWGALGVALTALLSAIIFGEPLTPVMVVGMALVIAGVLCVELGSGHAARKTEAAE
jgi:small multidrug resistance pump